MAFAIAGQVCEDVVRIADTLTLDQMEISEAVIQKRRAGLEVSGDAVNMAFDSTGNLTSL